MPMTRRQGITNRSKAKSQNARKRGPTPGFPAKSNTLSRQLLPISQADLHSSRTTTWNCDDTPSAHLTHPAIVSFGSSIASYNLAADQFRFFARYPLRSNLQDGIAIPIAVAPSAGFSTDLDSTVSNEWPKHFHSSDMNLVNGAASMCFRVGAKFVLDGARLR